MLSNDAADETSIIRRDAAKTDTSAARSAPIRPRAATTPIGRRGPGSRRRVRSGRRRGKMEQSTLVRRGVDRLLLRPELVELRAMALAPHAARLVGQVDLEAVP